MESIALKDFRENINNGTYHFGLNPEFLKHPAYESMIRQIDGFISGMSTDINFHENIEVVEENGVFSVQ